MTYKIQRPIPPYYIPLSDRIERQLDAEWNRGQKGKEEVERRRAGDNPVLQDIWLSIRSSEMLRDTMKALIHDIKSHNIQYTSYASSKRLYLHLKKCPENFKKELGNWTYYQPITQIRKPSNISDYDRTDW